MPFYKFKNKAGEEYGSFEVFYDELGKAGWYWWPCFPGCLPDGADLPHGPFPTEQDAINDAQKGA